MSGPRQEVPKGCTVGVIQIPDGILFFKNRDLASQYLTNRMTVWQSTPDYHVLKGANLKTGELQGIAIGVNRHGVCVANTHILSTADVTYDLLCEELVHEAQTRKDVRGIVEDFVGLHAVQGGRILVAAPGWTLLIEVLAHQFKIQDLQGNVAITNCFSLISDEVERVKIHEESSKHRLEVADSMVPTISSIGGLKSMLRSHLPEKGPFSICCHGLEGFGTESSHIIQVQGCHIGWSYLIGFPCENDYQMIEILQS